MSRRTRVVLVPLVAALAVAGILYWIPHLADWNGEAQARILLLIGLIVGSTLAAVILPLLRGTTPPQAESLSALPDALKHLEHERLEVRLAGLHQLERIGRGSDEQRKEVLGILGAFLTGEKGGEPSQDGMEGDRQAALDAIGALSREYQGRMVPVSLAGSVLRRANLPGVRLEGADLKRSDLSDSVLTGSFLNGTDLSNARLHRADLRGAQMRGAKLMCADLTHAHLEGAQLQAADLRDAKLVTADLERANLEGAILIQADLSGADLKYANLTRAYLRSTDFHGAELKGANLREVAMTALRQPSPHQVKGVNLEAVDLRLANLEGADLRKARMERADLRRARLRGANLHSADLRSACIELADLRQAQLDRSDLRAARIWASDLRGASLGEARLTEAVLDGCDLRGANLALLRAWQEIESIQHANIHGIRNAPPGFRSWALERGAVEVPNSLAWRRFRKRAGFQKPRE